MPEIKVNSTRIESLSTPVLVLPVLAGGKDGSVTVPDQPELSASLTAMKASSSRGVTARVPAPAGIEADSLLVVGLGAESLDEVTDEQLRQAYGAAARALTGLSSAAIALPGAGAARVAAAAEGFALGAYSFSEFKAEDAAKKDSPIHTVEVAAGDADADELTTALERVDVIVRSVHRIRDFVNTPPNLLCPEEFAARAEQAAKDHGVSVEILDFDQLVEGGYGGIVGVGQGSTRTPRLVTLTYTPKQAEKHVAIVGKGITFDTGGVSIKPAQGMDEMTSDMAGAATTLSAVLAAAELNLPVTVTGFLALAENMPGGNAQRPGDVVTMRNGTTVEVLNTDAEGRMVMADALVDAAALKPDLIIDIATLTGAAIVALGQRTAAVMGTDEARDEVFAASQSAGEAFWPLPFPEELRETLNGRVADLANIGDRWGGSLSAGIFLKEFTDSLPWAHLDIAGPAFAQKPHGYTTRGGTGMGLRTLLAVLEG